MFWFLFSAIPDASQTFYPDMSEAQLDLLLNWGPIIFTVWVPFITQFLTHKHGLYYDIKAASIMLVLSCVCRCVPNFLDDEKRNDAFGKFFCHFG